MKLPPRDSPRVVEDCSTLSSIEIAQVLDRKVPGGRKGFRAEKKARRRKRNPLIAKGARGGRGKTGAF